MKAASRLLGSTGDASWNGSASLSFRRNAQLLRALTVRDFKGQYRRSLLGPSWAIIQPLVYMVIFTFIRGVLTIDSEGVPYPIFTFSALVPWMFFSNAVTKAAPSVYSNRAIVKKMAMSREIFPLTAVTISIIDLVLSGTILAGMMIWYQVDLSASVVWLPVLFVLLVVLTVGVSLGAAAAGTYKHDVQMGIPFVLNFALFLTPVMYPLSEVPEARRALYSLNPMVGIVEGFRAVLVKGQDPDLGLLMISTVGTLLILAIGWGLFRMVSSYFADVL